MLNFRTWAITLVVALLLTALAACRQADAPEPAAPTNAATGSGSTAAAADPMVAPETEALSPVSSGVAAIAIAEATAAAPRSAPDPSVSAPSTTSAAPGTTNTPAAPEFPTAGAVSGDTLIQLIDPLDEPEFYCVDIRGFGSSLETGSSLQAHTCKPGAADKLFRFNYPGPGQFQMPAYELCLEAEAGLAYTRDCTGELVQQFKHGADGTIRTAAGNSCLSVDPSEGEPTGGRSHLRRDLQFLPCAAAERQLSRWSLPGENPDSAPGPATRLMHEALDSALTGNPWKIESMGANGDPAYIPVLVEMMRFPWARINRGVEEAIFEALDRIVEQNPGLAKADFGTLHDEWFQWVIWINRNPEVWPPPGFAAWKGRLYAELVDPEMGSFLYDGIRSAIRIEEIVWGGVRKDGIPDLTDAPVIAAAEADYLEPGGRVFGVSFNGEHRAYPHRIVNAHEMANDVVGGVPFALAY